MLLALVSGQRLGDISKMKFSDIWDDQMHIVQEKTGSKIAIPLRLNAINWSLQDVVTRCRDYGKRPARTVLTGMCYSVGSATRQGSSSFTRLTGQSAMTSST